MVKVPVDDASIAVAQTVSTKILVHGWFIMAPNTSSSIVSKSIAKTGGLTDIVGLFALRKVGRFKGPRWVTRSWMMSHHPTRFHTMKSIMVRLPWRSKVSKIRGIAVLFDVERNLGIKGHWNDHHGLCGTIYEAVTNGICGWTEPLISFEMRGQSVMRKKGA